MNYTLSLCRGVQWTSCQLLASQASSKEQEKPFGQLGKCAGGRAQNHLEFINYKSFKNGKATSGVLVHCFSMTAFILPFENVNFNLHQQICDFQPQLH